MTSAGTPDIDAANAMVRALGKRLGVHDARLDDQLDRSFGEVGVHFDPARRLVIGRTYVGRVDLRQMSAQGHANWAVNYRALSDPAIGGMFETGGARFVLDEDKEILFLVKEFPVASTSPVEFRDDMEELMNIAAAWHMRWIHRVVRIAHGHEAPPTAPVTRQNDPR